MASLGTNIDTVTNCVLVAGDVASIQYIRHFRFATFSCEKLPIAMYCPDTSLITSLSDQEFAEGRGHVVHRLADDASFEQYYCLFLLAYIAASHGSPGTYS
jgi:hypothetical protein